MCYPPNLYNNAIAKTHTVRVATLMASYCVGLCKGSLFVGYVPIPVGSDQSLLTGAYSVPHPAFEGAVSL